MSRRRVIDTVREPPIPTDPYLDVAPKHVWITDTVDNYTIVFSNTSWLVE